MANLVRYPGGSKNKGNYNKTGPFYIRIWLPNLKKVKLIPTYTENKRDAERKLRIIQEKEWLIKAEQSLLLAGLSEFRNDGKLITSINEAMGLDMVTTLKMASSKYLKSCEQRISITTIKVYRIALDNLLKALSSNTRVTELSKKHYEILLSYFKTNYSNKTTINIRLRAIRTFLYWLVENEYIEQIPFKIRQLKIDDALPKFIKPSEIKAIYSHVDDPVLLSTFKVYEATGMRLSELFHSKLNDKFLTVFGKGRKERLIPIPDSIIDDYLIAIAEFESIKDKANSELNDKGAINRRVNRYINSRTMRISHVFTDAVRLAGIKGKRSLHALRHTYALRMLVDLGDLHLVQKLLGHTSITTTEIYTKFPTDYLKNIFTARIPRDTISTIA